MGIMNWEKFNEANSVKCFDMLNEEEIENIINEDDLDLAMLDTQKAIGQDTGCICGVYFLGFDNSGEMWKNATPKERLEHLKKYLELEDSYKGLK